MGGDTATVTAPEAALYRWLCVLEAGCLVGVVMLVTVTAATYDDRPTLWWWWAAVIAVGVVVAVGVLWRPSAQWWRNTFVALTVGSGVFFVVTEPLMGLGFGGQDWIVVLVPIVFVAVSPLRRATLPAAAAAVGGTIAMAFVLWDIGRPAREYAPLRVVAVCLVVLVMARFAKCLSDVFYARAEAAGSLQASLAEAAERSVIAVSLAAAELRPPLAEIEAAAVAPDAAALGRIIERCGAVAAVVADLLAAGRERARLVDLQHESVDLAAALTAAASGTGHTLDARPRPLVIEADPALLEQAFTILMREFDSGPLRCSISETATSVEVELAGVIQPLPPTSVVRRETAEHVIAAHGGRLTYGPMPVLVLPKLAPLPALGGPADVARLATPPGTVLLTLVLFGVVGVGIGRANLWPGDVALYAAAAAGWAALLWFARFRTRSRASVAAWLALMIADLAVLVAVTGGALSPLWPLIFLPVGAALLLPLGWVVTAGAAATAALVVAFRVSDYDMTVRVWTVPGLSMPVLAACMLAPCAAAADRLGRRVEAVNSRFGVQRRETMTFLAIVAHELRTPLTSIRGYAELLRAGGWDAGTHAEFAAVIASETRRLAALVAELEAKVGDHGARTVVLADTDLARVVRRCVEAAAAAAPARRISFLAPDAVWASADAERLHEVVANLLDNALRYTPADADICVTVHRDEAKGRVTVEVADSGPGLPPAARARAFDAYWRAAGATGSGTGLGLAIAKALVEAHGPEAGIWVRDTPGGGATFGFAVPLAGADMRHVGGF